MKQRERSALSAGMSEAVGSVIDTAARYMTTFGLIAAVCGVGVLVYTFILAAGGGQLNPEQTQQNIAIGGQAAMWGLLALAVGLTWTWWGEETLGALIVIVGAGLYFSPYYMPLLAGYGASQATGDSLRALQAAGLPVGAWGLFVVLSDVMVRVRTRSSEGSRADQILYGKGLKEERDIQNVLMGKCWQLPYCRKFVRLKCPLYHSRRTCWRERVGCMCEEKVIQNAMAGRAVPENPEAALTLIPRNPQMSAEVKAERCRQCVIYNEHQKHKYKVALPVTFLALIGGCALFWTPLIGLSGNLLSGMDSIIARATYREVPAGPVELVPGGVVPLQEILLLVMMLIVLAYCLRAVEFFIFKLKI